MARTMCKVLRAAAIHGGTRLRNNGAKRFNGFFISSPYGLLGPHHPSSSFSCQHSSSFSPTSCSPSRSSSPSWSRLSHIYVRAATGGSSGGSTEEGDEEGEEEDGPVVFSDALAEFSATQSEKSGAWGEGEEEEEEEEEGEEETDSDTLRIPVSGVFSEGILDLSEVKPIPPDKAGHRSGYVCIVGPPNAGKSTLLNALVGEKLAIVTEKPQTTRHKILGIVNNDDYQMILMDTPGIMRKKMHKLDEKMMKVVKETRGNAEVMLAMLDASRDPIQMYERVGMRAGNLPMAVILNKVDKVRDEELEGTKTWFEENTPAQQVFTASALLGLGVQEICDWAASKLPLGQSLYPKDLLSEHPERFFITEIIREKIFQIYSQEVPYCCQVNVIEYKEYPTREDGTRPKDFVAVDIVVDTAGQKKIVIGAKGSKIKELSTKARNDIEKFLGRGVYIESKVKVRRGWRDNDIHLAEYGYQ